MFLGSFCEYRSTDYDYGKVLWTFANELQQNSDAFSKE